MECKQSESDENVENPVAKVLDIQPSNKKPKSCESDTVVRKENEKKKLKNKLSKNNNSTQGMKQSSLTSFFKTK